MILEEQLKQMRDSVMARMPQSAIKIMTDSVEEIRINKLKDKALQVGNTVPDFEFLDPDSKPYNLNDFLTNDFLILNFYRGGWCPYCNMELRAYEALRKDFLALGTDIIGISAEVTELAAQTSDKNSLSFPIVTDKDAEFMKSIGIVFTLDEASKMGYKSFGMDFTKIHDNENFELPVPAVYVINKNKEIVFVHFEEDYTTRLEPVVLLETLKNKRYHNNL